LESWVLASWVLTYFMLANLANQQDAFKIALALARVRLYTTTTVEI
jgi:hypothetical protein